MIFQEIRTSFAKNPYFCDFSGGSGPPVPPPSRSVHGHLSDKSAVTLKTCVRTSIGATCKSLIRMDENHITCTANNKTEVKVLIAVKVLPSVKVGNMLTQIILFHHLIISASMPPWQTDLFYHTYNPIYGRKSQYLCYQLLKVENNCRHFYPHAFLKKRRGYCSRLRLSVRHAISF